MDMLVNWKIGAGGGGVFESLVLPRDLALFSSFQKEGKEAWGLFLPQTTPFILSRPCCCVTLGPLGDSWYFFFPLSSALSAGGGEVMPTNFPT